MRQDILLGLAAALVVIILWYEPGFLPLVLLGGLVLFMLRFSNIKMPRLNTIGSGKVNRDQIDFNQIGGQEVAKKELLEALDFVIKPDKLKEMGIRPLKGVMLVGPPGPGKTQVARVPTS